MDRIDIHYPRSKEQAFPSGSCLPRLDMPVKEIPRFQPCHQSQESFEANMRRIAQIADTKRRRVSDDYVNGSAMSEARKQQLRQESGYSEPHLSFSKLLSGAWPIAY